MADPLSIAASIGGLALLARDVVKEITSVIKTVRTAKSELQALRQSVALLCGYLESLSLMIDEEDDAPAPQSILACNHTLDEIKRILMKCHANPKSSTGLSSAPSAKTGTWQDMKQKVRWVIKKEEAEKLLTELEKHKSVLSLALSKQSLSSIIQVLRKQDEASQKIEEIQKGQSQIREHQIQNTERRMDKERRKILDAMSTTRPEDSFKKHFSLRQDGTGVWFLQSLEFEKFMSTPRSKLWLYGIPGAGKSVLSATIIERMGLQRTEKVASAFFFCEYFDKATQSCRSIFGSIARQLALQNPRALEALVDFYNDETDLGQRDFIPADAALLNLICQMSISFETTIIVIDGLDECLENRATIVENLTELNRNGHGSIKTLFTSREESDIKQRLTSFDSLAIAASKADIRLYVAAQLKSRFKRLCDRDPALSEQILDVLVDKSNGMFQWVRCQIDYLEKLATNKQRREALDKLPPTLKSTYERILLRAIETSEDSTIQFVERTLRWIALAKEPLSTDQMAHAISVEVGEHSFDGSLEMDIILALCSSLVREVDGILTFSHFSVKEFLVEISSAGSPLSRFKINDSDHSSLAQACLSYLLLDDFDRQGLVSSTDLKSADDQRDWDIWVEDPYPKYPFYQYAAYWWTDHVEIGRMDEAVSRLTRELFDTRKTDNFLFWAHFSTVPFVGPGDNFTKKIYGVTPLHMACIIHSADLVDHILCEGVDVNANSEILGSPLQCAITNKFDHKFALSYHASYAGAQYEIVCRLLRENISVDQSRYDPVAEALRQENEKVSYALLKHGFHLTVGAIANLTPGSAPEFLQNINLDELDDNVKLAVTKKLAGSNRPSVPHDGVKLQKEAMPAHLEQDYMDVIMELCFHGRIEQVKDILSRLPSLTGDRLRNFLSLCLIDTAAHGHAGLVRFLADAGANLTYQRNSDGRTALHTASSGCHVEVVKLLLELQDSDDSSIGTRDGQYFTPWMYAVEVGSVEVLNLFLGGSFPIDLQIAGKDGQTVAHLAAKSLNEQMILYLHEKQVDFTRRDAFGKTPMHILLERFQDDDPDDSEDSLDSIERIFRLLKYRNMLCEQSQTGDNLIHLLVRLPPSYGKRLWRNMPNESTFDGTRGRALAMANEQKDTPLHIILRETAHPMKQQNASLLGQSIELVQSLLAGDDDAREYVHAKDEDGCTPVMAFMKAVRYTDFPLVYKHLFSQTVLKILKTFHDAEQGVQSWQEDDHQRTILHFVAACRTNFPFREVTEFVLEKQLDVHTKDSDGNFPLTCAASESEENVEFMQLLIPRMSLCELEEQNNHGKTSLHYICSHKKPGIQGLVARYLLSHIAKCTKKDSEGRIPLTYAPTIITHDAIALQLVQDASDTIDICDEDGRNCMYWSCALGSTAMVSALLEAGADINAQLGPEDEESADRNPPLLIAAKSEQFQMVDFLLENGADPLVKGKSGWQLQHFAFRLSGQPLRTILTGITGVDYHAKTSHLFVTLTNGEELDFKEVTPFHLAIIADNETGMQWLLDEGIVTEVNVEIEDGSTPLILAALFGHVSICKKLIRLGGLLSKARNDGFTALHVACEYGRLEICQILVVADKECVFQNSGGRTPLDIAAAKGHKDIVELLLKHGCEATVEAEMAARISGHKGMGEFLQSNISSSSIASPGNTAIVLEALRLKAACESANESTLVDVLQHDINPNIRLPPDHRTPLHIASGMGWIKALELLVERGANLEALDAMKRTPLMVAVRFRKWKCTDLLLCNGAQVMNKDRDGLTALHMATQWNDADRLSQFLELGADANVQTYTGDTPLFYTSDVTCVELLLQHGANPFLIGAGGANVAWHYCHHSTAPELLKMVFDNKPAEEIQRTMDTFCWVVNSTALYHAAFIGNAGAVSALLQYGAKANTWGGALGAPIHAALKQGHAEVATGLLKNGARPFRVIRDGEEHAVWHWEYGYDFCLQAMNGTWRSGAASVKEG